MVTLRPLDPEDLLPLGRQALKVMESADAVSKYALLGSMAAKEVTTRSVLQALPGGGIYPNALTGPSSPFDYQGLGNFTTGPAGRHAHTVPEYVLGSGPRVDPAFDLAVGMPAALPPTWSSVGGVSLGVYMETLTRRGTYIDFLYKFSVEKYCVILT